MKNFLCHTKDLSFILEANTGPFKNFKQFKINRVHTVFQKKNHDDCTKKDELKGNKDELKAKRLTLQAPVMVQVGKKEDSELR